MTTQHVDLDKFDLQMRRELAVAATAWLRANGPSVVELRRGADAASAIATVTNEGDRWAVRPPDQMIFVGSETQARTLLWQCASRIPQPPAAASTPAAPPRQPWDHFGSAT